jgi:hypothetical protein
MQNRVASPETPETVAKYLRLSKDLKTMFNNNEKHHEKS